MQVARRVRLAWGVYTNTGGISMERARNTKAPLTKEEDAIIFEELEVQRKSWPAVPFTYDGSLYNDAPFLFALCRGFDRGPTTTAFNSYGDLIDGMVRICSV